MSRPLTRDLAGFLEERAGDYLRAVGHYTQDSYEILYLRDDIQTKYAEDQIEEIVEELRWGSFAKSNQEGLYNLGTLNCTVQCFDEGVVMQFFHDETSGALVSLDPEAASQLHRFVGECLQEIREEYPPE
ncbi:hypothetical protein C2R22_23260 (plasmid) [Salinigranum rubrum]|uniref:Uncharacterized protein n=1 Tax=Salinigranum rubrum TaxID=755307 RepID=A0A2I8VRC5_9EURY|nr:hypothetical protein [Salinigranum rubrum]AUV84468.1 hypothetical protein C2R22_23260 [Salinigranum rubrum]